MLVVGLVFGIIAVRGQHRGFISMALRSIGGDLVKTTNSLHLVHISPQLHARLSDLLAARTHVAEVLLGDEPSPVGDGTACSRLVLTNEVGQGLVIRLRPAKHSAMFEVPGFRSLTRRY